MKPSLYWFAGVLVVVALALGGPTLYAQARPHGGGGSGGGTRVNSGGGSSGTAVSRGSGGGSGSGGSHVTTSSSGSKATASSGSAAPRGSRPRYGRVATGSAVERTGGYPVRGHGGHSSYYPYDPYYLYGYGAFGLGAYYYDPYWWGGSPYWGNPYGPYAYGGGYGYGYGAGYDDPQGYGIKGGLKLKVTPKDAEVYVDGYYVGIVDDYDGAFQRLAVTAGPHRLELRAKGYETLAVDVRIEPRDTITYHGELQPSAAAR